jgi:hypothetical protein
VEVPDEFPRDVYFIEKKKEKKNEKLCTFMVE